MADSVKYRRKNCNRCLNPTFVCSLALAAAASSASGEESSVFGEPPLVYGGPGVGYVQWAGYPPPLVDPHPQPAAALLPLRDPEPLPAPLPDDTAAEGFLSEWPDSPQWADQPHWLEQPPSEDRPVWDGVAEPVASWVPSGPPHLVLESPEKQASYAGYEPIEPYGRPAPRSLHERMHGHHPPHPTSIPDAARMPVWKQPYSYGHFGAPRHRQWHLQYGHQRTYTRWTLR